ncbi:type I-U CRISPR-associated RAMP protein Csb1/Cas7u [Microbispora sp. GKU 823]|uniref:type I-G CRISPR-associated RAMP protein Csb1/Cas7g n=1 Tax=Microbispora sp. GKU 823 TaxID=1652100 RepID=UPI0009A36C2A|nr:type I-U CRISPR-associated RAMP protein Csb1/Cas7u [Microbispora sp. GKU 823]OPG09290.1 type I-U CRISPR-associated protein Cas7 [Microbispora sp. GKU 823]
MIPLDRPRLRFTADLQPLLGSTFQATNFPDIGSAKFQRAQGGDSLLVESVQSMANRLEGMAWDRASHRPVPLIEALPYVRVHRRDDPEVYLTSSREEAHRLASAFVREATLDGTPMMDVIRDRLGLVKDTPLDYPLMARAVLGLDPFCLLHGVFFSRKEWLGQPRFTRAVSAVIEAYDVREVVSGGRKADHVRHQLGEGGGTSEGYGSVPFHRVEWNAGEIKAMFVVDVDLLASYGLGPEITELLVLTALWEIRTLLSRGLRLRTACDLEVVEEPKDLPQQAELETRISELIAATGVSADPITVLWKG